MKALIRIHRTVSKYPKVNLDVKEKTPWRTDYDLIEFTVQFTGATSQDSVAGIRMSWCSLIDSDDYELGCIDRLYNYYESELFTVEPTFNPFKPNYDFYQISMEQIERRDKIQRFSNSKIS